MLGKNPADDILINGGPERQIDLFSDTRASPDRIALFHLDNRADQIGCGPFRTRLGFLIGREQQPIFSVHQCAMKVQQRGWLQRDRDSAKPTRPNPKRTDSSDQPILGRRFGAC
jgi:hypothetical protein